MKNEEVIKMDRKTLENKLGELRRELFELNVERHMKKEAGGIKKSHELKLKRKGVARILTALNNSKENRPL